MPVTKKEAVLNLFSLFKTTPSYNEYSEDFENLTEEEIIDMSGMDNLEDIVNSFFFSCFNATPEQFAERREWFKVIVNEYPFDDKAVLESSLVP